MKKYSVLNSVLLKIFSVGIGLSASGALKFSAVMTGMWDNPFNVKYFSIGNTELTAAFLPSFNLIELGKKMLYNKLPFFNCIFKRCNGNSIITSVI